MSKEPYALKQRPGMLIDYELAEHELALLLAACECVGNQDRLADEAAGGAVTVTNSRGDQVASVAMIGCRGPRA